MATHTVEVTVQDGGCAEYLLSSLGTAEAHKKYGIVKMGCDCAHKQDNELSRFSLLVFGFFTGVVFTVMYLLILNYRMGA